MPKEIIKTKVDILLISETKLDSSFTFTQFHIDGFTSPCRCDRNRNDGGITLQRGHTFQPQNKNRIRKRYSKYFHQDQ